MPIGRLQVDLSELPPDLPVPKDDGAGSHLTGTELPAVSLPTTSGGVVRLDKLRGLQVLYVYPMTGRPGVALPNGWDAIPGARGCTPQSCAFRDHHADLKALNVGVYGISTQSTAGQCEAKARLHLPFELLSDDGLLLENLLQLPIFVIDGQVFYKRLTLIVHDGVVIKTFYPIFLPDRNPDQVLEWLRGRPEPF